MSVNCANCCEEASSTKTKNETKGICYLVVPCYNEEEMLPISAPRLVEKLYEMIESGLVADISRIVLVDDGSKDGTWSVISSLCSNEECVIGIKLAHNRGHQNALYAGLMYAKDRCDFAISLDADLQDDVNVLGSFVDEYSKGCQVVYGVRKSRETDSFFKRSTAHAFYKLMQLFGVETIADHADYRLMSAVALKALEEYKEVNLFLRGIVPDLGFKTGVVYYSRNCRAAGQSKYPLRKMISFAIEGMTSFSVVPLKVVSNLGFLVSAGSIIGLIYALLSKFLGTAVSGWTAIVCSIWLLGGIQLLSLGIVGTYIGKIYSETKSRPRYIVEETIER